MGVVPLEMVDCGLDWATFTVKGHVEGTRFALLAESLLLQERDRGCFLQPWSISGYEGFLCGQVAAGVRHDSGIVRLSGALAQTEWRTFYEQAENCSRIDLQATYRFPSQAGPVIASTYRGVLNHRRRSKRGPTISIWKTAGGSATIYFGKRVSERYGRIYDKGLESKLDHYNNCVRYELEVKGNLAWTTVNDLARECGPIAGPCPSKPELAYIHRKVVGYFGGLGVTTQFATIGDALLRSATPRSSLTVSLEWLRTQVLPTVEKLRSHGFNADVENLLGLRPGGPHS